MPGSRCGRAGSEDGQRALAALGLDARGLEHFEAKVRPLLVEHCLECHGDPALQVLRDGEAVSLFVDEERYGLSEHATVACAQCHTEVSPSHERACDTITSPVDCSTCHAEVVQKYLVLPVNRTGGSAPSGDCKRSG